MLLVFSLLAGLIMTVTLQFVLTSLGAALGLSVLSFSPKPSSETDISDIQYSQSDLSLPISHLVGFGIALSQTIVLFCSSLAMTEFGQINEPRRGLIFGVILWSTYWILLIWLSSTTVVSIADSVIGTTVVGSKRLISVLHGAIKGENFSSSELDTLQRLTTEISKISQQQEQLPKLLAQQRQKLLDAISNQHSLAVETSFPSDQPINSSSKSSETHSDDFNRSPTSTASKMANRSMRALKAALSFTASQLDLPGWKELLQKGMSEFDWSDWDLETLWYQLQALTSENSQQHTQDAIIRDVENYICSAPAWSFKLPQLEVEFYNRLYDPQADPQAIIDQLAKLDRAHFSDWLEARKDFSPQQVNALVNKLIEIRDRVLHSLPSHSQPSHAEENKRVCEIQKKIINYCRYTNREALTSEGMMNKVKALLEAEQELSLTPINQALDIDAIQSVLRKRQGISKKQWQPIIQSLESAWSELRDKKTSFEDAVSLHLPRPWAMRVVHSPQNLWQKLNEQLISYFSYQDKEAFTPTQIFSDLSQIVRTELRSLPDPSDLLQLSSMFDSEVSSVWERALEKRRDMTHDEIDRILGWCDSIWKETLQTAEQSLQSLFSMIIHTVSASKLNADPERFLGAMGRQLSEPLEIIQDKVEQQTESVTAELRLQADKAKNQVKIAAWWLFGSLVCSALSAAVAGWVAVLY